MDGFTVNGETWRVVRVAAGDPRLIDRTGELRVATTDPTCRCVFLSASLTPPMLDRVLLHEVAHAVTVSYGLLPTLRGRVRDGDNVGVEEWAANLMENHAMEAVRVAATVLGRPPCVRGECG